MNRDDLQALAALRLAESRALLKAGHTSGAYYLAGYAVECALKAVIASQTRQYDFPDKQRANESFVHDLEKLVKVARLDKQLDSDGRIRPQLKRNWSVVQEWSESSRYSLYDLVTAESMLVAVGTETHGVLQWITQYW